MFTLIDRVIAGVAQDYSVIWKAMMWAPITCSRAMIWEIIFIVRTGANSCSIPTDWYTPNHHVSINSSLYFIIRHSFNPTTRAFEFMQGTGGITTMAKPAYMGAAERNTFWCSVTALTSSIGLLSQCVQLWLWSYMQASHWSLVPVRVPQQWPRQCHVSELARRCMLASKLKQSFEQLRHNAFSKLCCQYIGCNSCCRSSQIRLEQQCETDC